MRALLFALKAANLGIITVYQFALIYVLVRVVGPGLYPWVVLLASLGNYVLNTDLGFSGYVYAHVRRHFLADGLRDRLAFISHSLMLYVAVSLLAIALAAGGIFLLTDLAPSLKLSLALYFASIVLALPWALVRRIAAAVDLFVFMEVVELVRRLSALMLAGAMLIGLPFGTFALLSIACWALVYGAALMVLSRRGVRVERTTRRALLGFMGENRGNIALTGGLTGLEFAIYNFPYLALPLMFGGPAYVVAFDIFYKVTRFGGVAYNVPIETMLPAQTRAFHSGDVGAVRRYRHQALLLGALPLAGAAAFLLLFGQRFFGVLLNHSHPIDPALRYVMVAMLAAMLLQMTAGAFMVGIGRYRAMTRIAMLTTSLMALAVGATIVLKLDFFTFMMLYVLAYCVHAALFHRAFAHDTQAS